MLHIVTKENYWQPAKVDNLQTLYHNQKQFSPAALIMLIENEQRNVQK